MSNKPYVVVAGTDFSEQAVRALRVAYEQAEQHAPAELHVVHVTSAASPEQPPEALPAPAIEPPCPRCVAARRASPFQLWCAQHSERHGRRHTVYQRDRMGADTNLPLVVR
jgi:hypothetical protein